MYIVVMKINLVRTPQGLTAADDEAAKKLNRLGDGEIVEVSIKKLRSYRQMKYYRAMLQKVYDNLPEAFDGRYPSVDNFHVEMKFLTGQVKVQESVTGDRIVKVKSTSFEGMKHEDFTGYVQMFKDKVHEFFIPEFDFTSMDKDFMKYYGKLAG